VDVDVDVDGPSTTLELTHLREHLDHTPEESSASPAVFSSIRDSAKHASRIATHSIALPRAIA